jgi:transposase
MQQWTPPRQVILELQMLLTERKRLVKWKREIKASSKELVYFEKSPALKVAITINRQLLNTIETELSKIEKAIEQVVATDPLLAEQAKLLTSITGVGKVLTSYLIVKTNEFKTLNDPRKIACYAGVVPFEHTSGTSLRGKNRLSGYADKQLKTLLHLSAMSVIRLEGELRDYYRRKVAEGKNKMSVLNAVRNKLVHRICAVVRDQRIYKPNLEMS